MYFVDPGVSMFHNQYLVSSVLQAYLEFFISPENVKALKVILKDYPLVNYHIVNHSVSYISLSEYCIQLQIHPFFFLSL